MKTVDRAADLGERMKKALVRTADQAQNLTDDGQVTPSEYAGDQLQYGMEDITMEAGHIIVDTGKGAYRTGKSAIQKFREKRRAEAEQRRQELENETLDTPVDEPADPVTPDQPGPATPPESPIEEEIVTHSGSQQRKTRIGKLSTGDGPKGKLNTAKDGADTIQKEQQIKGPARRRNSSIKALQKTEKTIKQSTRTAEQSAKTLERSVKGTQKTVKTAEQSSKVAIKTAQETAKTAQKSAQAAAKAAEKAVQIARATAQAAAAAAKAAAKACATAVKAIIAAAKELVAAIAAGAVSYTHLTLPTMAVV